MIMACSTMLVAKNRHGPGPLTCDPHNFMHIMLILARIGTTDSLHQGLLVMTCLTYFSHIWA